jgi:hypothetical protein
LLKSLEIREGERCDFGFVHWRADKLVRVRVIAVWAEGAKEVWWLATNLDNRVSKVVSYYDRRMGIEEQFRDAKGHRFGLKLRWTQFTKAEFVERLYLLVGVALLLWTSVGSAVEEEGAGEKISRECCDGSGEVRRGALSDRCLTKYVRGTFVLKIILAKQRRFTLMTSMTGNRLRGWVEHRRSSHNASSFET